MPIKYSKKVLEYFMNPKNIGEMENPDVVVEEGNPVCGDMLRMYLKVRDGRIEDIKFLSFGCAANIATGSILTEMVKGKTLEEAKKVTMKDIAEKLEGLPPIKMHCAILAAKALHKAIEEYEKSKVKNNYAKPK